MQPTRGYQDAEVKSLRRKLFIHVGPPKTGSSAVQHILRNHDNTVVVYPKVGLWKDGSHHNLVFNFYQDFRRAEVVQCSIQELFKKIDAETCQSNLDVVISSEALANRDIDLFINALISSLGKTAWAPEIIFVCREHFERASSLYNQLVKDAHSMERRSPDDYLRQHAKGLCYASVLNDLKKSAFPLSVLNYHPAVDFVPRFMTHIGFTDSFLYKNERRNVSLSIKGLIATLAANMAAKTMDDRHRYFAALRRMRGFFASSQSIFQREAAIDADSLFREDRAFLLYEFGVTLAAPNLHECQCQFFLNHQQLKEIIVATQELGLEGEAIANVAHTFLKT